MLRKQLPECWPVDIAKDVLEVNEGEALPSSVIPLQFLHFLRFPFSGSLRLPDYLEKSM